jgi:hypothetical protein
VIVDNKPASVKRIVDTQAKNEHRNAVHIDVPLHPELERIIDATPSGHLAFLVTAFGKPFTPAGFGNWFGDRCRAAGVTGRAHGLPKATATRLAELSATARMIPRLIGHRTLQEVGHECATGQKCSSRGEILPGQLARLSASCGGPRPQNYIR